MALALRFALVLITLACLGLFLLHPFWFPAQASAQAPALDRGLKIALWVLGALFIAGQLVLALFLRSSPGEASSRNWRGNWRFEIAWTAAVAAVFFWFNVSGGGLWSQMMSPEKHLDAIHVEVTGAQFQWYFRYPGADGTFGRVDARRFARPDEGNPLGIDPDDPAGKDDIVSPALVLPVGRPVELDLRAQDVIHSVFIPEMRIKRDAVPGMDIHTQFIPTKTGTFEMVCSQLCGLGHYRMKAAVRVVSEAEFKDWLKNRSPQPDAGTKDLQALYDRHQWFELREALRGRVDQPLFRGAVACAFSELPTCEESLKAIIRASRRSTQAREADEILENVYLRAGQYRKALARARARLELQPDDEDAKNDYALLAVLGQGPDQFVNRRGYSTVPWRTAGTGFTAPVTINGRSGTYVFDSGAGISTINESEAKRLGLSVRDSGAKAGNIAGGEIAFRTAVADELVIGGFRLKHVAFLVFRDDQLPSDPADTPTTGVHGLIGLPVMLALGRLRWNSDGSLEIGFPPNAERASDPNLFFDGSTPAIVAEVQGRRLNFFLDTGAEETRLFPPFADTFASLISQSGKKESAQITGVGETTKVDSIVLLDLKIGVGGFTTVLQPARVLLSETSHGSLLYYGNLGVDLLRQAKTVTFDFRSMRLTLE